MNKTRLNPKGANSHIHTSIDQNENEQSKEYKHPILHLKLLVHRCHVPLIILNTAEQGRLLFVVKRKSRGATFAGGE